MQLADILTVVYTESIAFTNMIRGFFLFQYIYNLSELFPIDSGTYNFSRFKYFRTHYLIWKWIYHQVRSLLFQYQLGPVGLDKYMLLYLADRIDILDNAKQRSHQLTYLADKFLHNRV